MARPVTLLAQPNGTYRITRRIKKRRPLFRVIYIKMKIVIWNLSPLHWYEDFKEIQINMDEFACKKQPKEKK
jgi:hypothetical protein